MVSSASPFATEAGLAVLRKGGNAVDAAVAVAMTLAVTYPSAGNLGGGGFMVARINGTNVALDFREIAPAAATRDMYLGGDGKPTDRSVTGALAAGVPGSVAGLYEAHRKYGTRPWGELLQTAITLADSGFAIDSAFRDDDTVIGRAAFFAALSAGRVVKVSGTLSGTIAVWSEFELED